MNSTLLNLLFLTGSQEQKHVTHNEALRMLDGIVQLRVVNATETAPPATPTEGQRYIVAAGATGAWAGWDGDIAMYVDGAWLRLTPNYGWRAWNADTQELLLWIGSWTTLDAAMGLLKDSDVQTSTIDTTAGRLLTTGAFGLGLADAAPEVVADLDATTTASGIYRVIGSTTLNRPGTVGNGLLLLQRYTATTFNQIVIANNGSEVWVRTCNADSFTAWQQVYTQASVLGTVSQSGGVPTGALMEYGSGAGGEYVRLANGLQICWATVTAAYINASYCAANWTYQVAFAAAPVSQITLDGAAWGTDVPSGVLRGDVNTVRGNNTTTALSAQLWAASGSAFASGDAPKLQCWAIGLW